MTNTDSQGYIRQSTTSLVFCSSISLWTKSAALKCTVGNQHLQHLFSCREHLTGTPESNFVWCTSLCVMCQDGAVITRACNQLEEPKKGNEYITCRLTANDSSLEGASNLCQSDNFPEGEEHLVQCCDCKSKTGH